MSDQPTNFQQEGYADAVPVSPDENPGDASKELNTTAHEAYAEAYKTGKLSEA
jgi:hypothetical protein